MVLDTMPAPQDVPTMSGCAATFSPMQKKLALAP
jgi:hypothetical protein